MVDPKDQEVFDLLLGNGIKMVYTEGFTEKLISGISQKEPSMGLAMAGKTVLDRLSVSVGKSGKQVPTEMIPDLLTEITATIAEASEAAGKPVPPQAIAKAVNSQLNLVEEEMSGGLPNNDSNTPSPQESPVPQQRLPQENKAIQPAQSQLSERQAKRLTQQSSPARGGAMLTMTEKLDGGLLR